MKPAYRSDDESSDVVGYRLRGNAPAGPTRLNTIRRIVQGVAARPFSPFRACALQGLS